MSPSLRDLIDHILAEITLCGARGSSSFDILSYINAFYSKTNVSYRNHAVDRRFQEKVWSWLVKHPEVSVGKNREGNHLNLTELERLVDSKISTQLVRGQSVDNATPDGRSELADSMQELRVFVSDERAWLTIAGHEPDETKILPTEFALLSIIAAAKSKGVVQTDLVRLSGQDKRSIPKRTDELQRKGYIQKRPIHIKGTRTSLCTHWRFAQGPIAPDMGGSREGVQAGDMIDFGLFLGKLFDILKQYKLISRDDLKKLLGFTDLWRWRILSRSLRRLERIGVIKRVRAPSQYNADKKRDLHACVMLVREPSDEDFDKFHHHGWSLIDSSEQMNHGLDDENDGCEQREANLGVSDIKCVIGHEDGIEEAGRTIPSWNPDRSVNNQIFDTVDRAGIRGITGQNIGKICFGNFFRKSLENRLSHLVDSWLFSQPRHLRHLAIVRDTTLVQRMTLYVYYSVRNFQQLADAGQLAWEAVQPAAASGGLDPHISSVNTVPELSPYGLPQITSKHELLKGGSASAAECVLAAKPEDYFRSSSDAAIARLEDGTYFLVKGCTGVHQGTQLDTGRVRPRGRPRGTSNWPKAMGPSDSSVGNLADISYPPRAKGPTREDRLAGLPEKQRLEALGLDETWTEYNALVMDRSGPGVYVTPRGRRRPVGKRQGRPRISRIAVFKSPSLVSLPWFCVEQEYSANEDNLLSPHAPSPSGVQPTSAKIKRKRSSGAGFADTQSDLLAEDPCNVKENQWKRRRLNDAGPQITEDPVIGTSSESLELTSGKLVRDPVGLTTEYGSPGSAKRQRLNDSQCKDARARELTLDHVSEATLATSQQAKRLNVESSNDEERFYRESDITGESFAEAGLGSPVEGSAVLPAATATKSSTGITVAGCLPSIPDAKLIEDLHELYNDQDNQLPAKAKRPRPMNMNMERGGSVALMRRKIITDIIDRAGGAYPWGAELWYPFATAWGKTEYKGLPDLRTVKSAARLLIDAGKLRQMTFSGRDSKGVMVTKCIIAKPELEPDDPVIKDLQRNMLADTKYYFPPNTEIDPTIRKRGISGRSTGVSKTVAPVPIETGITVQLHERPAFVMREEKRKGRRIQEELLQIIESEPRGPKQRQSGVIRLMKIHRPLAKSPASISRPQPGSSRVPAPELRRLRSETSTADSHGLGHHWHPISMIAPFAMLLWPRQTFHLKTGTFSTDASIAALYARRADELHLSLDELLKETRRKRHAAPAIDTEQQDANRFFAESDAILQWELENKDVLRDGLGSHRYVNQVGYSGGPARATDYKGSIQFVSKEDQLLAVTAEPIMTRQRARRRSRTIAAGEEGLRSSLQPDVWTPEIVDHATSDRKLRLSRLTQMIDGSLAAGETQYLQEGEEALRVPIVSKGKRPTRGRRLSRLSGSLNAEEPGAAASSVPAHRNITRRRFTSQLEPSLVQRIMTAIVVVRSLAGGLEGKTVDWNLLPRGFPSYDAELIQERGKSILSKKRLQLTKMQSDFQDRFISAYAVGEVPRIDYDNLEEYDWERVVDWANDHVDAPTLQKLPDLPATREQFDSLFELREEATLGIDELYQTVQNVTIGRKRALQARVAFSVPLLREMKPNRKEITRLEVAKTWIRANVTSPEEMYQSAEAWTALRQFDDSLIESAVQSLVSDRVISMSNRGRITPGRNYDVTDHFLSIIGRRRAIEHTQLRRAARFKTDILDPELRTRESFDVSYHAEDGDILALINLAAEGRILLKPREPPVDKFGLTEGSYVTRQLDKEKLRFNVEVKPVAGSYVDGSPLYERLSSLPSPHWSNVTVIPEAPVPEAIPIWFDIHGQLNRFLWEQVVAAVVGCVAIRPGISAASAASMIKPAMGAWEVQMLLEWMEEAGMVRYEGPEKGEQQSGWRVQEWWWMALG